MSNSNKEIILQGNNSEHDITFAVTACLLFGLIVSELSFILIPLISQCFKHKKT